MKNNTNRTNNNKSNVNSKIYLFTPNFILSRLFEYYERQYDNTNDTYNFKIFRLITSMKSCMEHSKCSPLPEQYRFTTENACSRFNDSYFGAKTF